MSTVRKPCRGAPTSRVWKVPLGSLVVKPLLSMVATYFLPSRLLTVSDTLVDCTEPILPRFQVSPASNNVKPPMRWSFT